MLSIRSIALPRGSVHVAQMMSRATFFVPCWRSCAWCELGPPPAGLLQRVSSHSSGLSCSGMSPLRAPRRNPPNDREGPERRCKNSPQPSTPAPGLPDSGLFWQGFAPSSPHARPQCGLAPPKLPRSPEAAGAQRNAKNSTSNPKNFPSPNLFRLSPLQEPRPHSLFLLPPSLRRSRRHPSPPQSTSIAPFAVSLRLFRPLWPHPIVIPHR